MKVTFQFNSAEMKNLTPAALREYVQQLGQNFCGEVSIAAADNLGEYIVNFDTTASSTDPVETLAHEPISRAQYNLFNSAPLKFFREIGGNYRADDDSGISYSLNFCRLSAGGEDLYTVKRQGENYTLALITSAMPVPLARAIGCCQQDYALLLSAAPCM